MIVLAIDPGNEQSAFLVYDGARVLRFGKWPNERLLNELRLWDEGSGLFAIASCIAIEMIASYGMPVGREVFETCVWIGSFLEAANQPQELVYRKDVKLHLCGSARAKDGNVRQALIDRFGGKDKAIGKKATPGPLYGISADVWSALAIAVTYSDKHIKEQAA